MLRSKQKVHKNKAFVELAFSLRRGHKPGIPQTASANRRPDPVPSSSSSSSPTDGLISTTHRTTPGRKQHPEPRSRPPTPLPRQVPATSPSSPGCPGNQARSRHQAPARRQPHHLGGLGAPPTGVCSGQSLATQDASQGGNSPSLLPVCHMHLTACIT